MENTIAKQFRLSQRGGQNGRSPNALSYAQFGSCADAIEVNMEFVRMKAWDLQKSIDKVKGSYEQACEHSSDFPTGQLKRKLSHLGQRCQHGDREFIVDSGRISPHDE